MDKVRPNLHDEARRVYVDRLLGPIAELGSSKLTALLPTGESNHDIVSSGS